MNRLRGINFKTGKAFFRAEFYSVSIYRISFWLRFVYTFLMMYSMGYIWKALYHSNPKALSVSLPEIVTYSILGVALEAILHPFHGPKTYMMEQVRKGTIEMDIMKPIDFQFYMFAKNMGSIMVKLICQVFPPLVVAYFFFGFNVPHITQVLAFFVSLALGILVSFLLNYMLGLLSMIIMNIQNISWGYNATLRFFSGQMVPLVLFPGVIGVLSAALPFRCIYSIPMSIYVGSSKGMEMLGDLGLQAVWVIVLFAASRLMMRHVFRRLMIQGG
jgi:ABC-2 type transport system permease protein